MKRYALVTVALLLFSTPVVLASSSLPVSDRAYDILRRLEAEGIVTNSTLTTLPLTRAEIVRLVGEAELKSAEKGPVIREQVEYLKHILRDDLDGSKYFKPLDSVEGEYIYSSGRSQTLTYNRDGDSFRNGSSARLSASSRAEFGHLSFEAAPELIYSGNDTDLLLKRAYGAASFLGLEIAAGKDSQWWGPGYHGSLLLSNNAKPLSMIRLGNVRPVLLPWVFSRLGLFRFSFFASQLEDDRDVPEPYLWGLRLSFKPSPYLEAGLERTALLGGEGRSEDLGTWLKSFTGKGENDSGTEAGDQRAGGDVKVTLPFSWQPVQLYLEAAGEDEAGGLPSKWAYLGGVYLPGIFSLDRVDFRAEYATTHLGDSNAVWYSHHVYTSGYTYKGDIIGHHMGGDSDDLFFEVSYLLPAARGEARLSYDRERHDLSEDNKPLKNEISVEVDFLLREKLIIQGLCRTAWLDDGDGQDDEETGTLAFITATYQF